MTLRLLIADDSLMYRKLIARYLAKRRGVVVVGEAVSGDEALRQTADLKPDIVILDVSMPDQSCAKVCRTIRQQSPATKIYLCSAHSDGVLYEIASTVKAKGVLRKSLLRSDLLNMLEDEMEGNGTGKTR